MLGKSQKVTPIADALARTRAYSAATGHQRPKRGRGHHLTPMQRRHARRKAARLLWCGSPIGQESIARACGISRRTLVVWLADPAFLALVAAERARYLARIEQAHAAEADRRRAASDAALRGHFRRLDARLARLRRRR